MSFHSCLVQLMDINESPVYVLLNPAINHAQKDLPVTIYESGKLLFHIPPALLFTVEDCIYLLMVLWIHTSSFCLVVCFVSYWTSDFVLIVVKILTFLILSCDCLQNFQEFHVIDGIPQPIFVHTSYTIEVCVKAA